MMRKLFCVSILSVVLTGCLKTRADIEAERAGHDQQKQTNDQQRAVAREKAAPQAVPVVERNEDPDEQMRTLNGRIDTLENYVQQQNALKENEKENGGKERQAIDAKFQAYEEELKSLSAQVASLNEEVARLKAPPPEVAAAKGKSPYEAGESLFAAKKYKEAIVNYQKYRDQNSKGKMYPDATYKIGVCFQELGMKDEARAFLEEVTSKFPKSKEAKKAALRLKTLK